MRDPAPKGQRNILGSSHDSARIYRDNFGLIFRLVFIAFAALEMSHLRLWPTSIIIAWYLSYLAFDVSNSAYLAKTSFNFLLGSEAEKQRIKWRLGLLTTIPSWIVTLPLYWIPGHGLMPSLAAIMFCCAVIMLFSAHHAIGGYLIALTIPPISGALLYNLYKAAPPQAEVFALTLGVMYILISLVVHHEVRSVFYEFTKSKNAAEIANRAKNTFLSGISHEIRTPLNGIIGLSQAVLLSERPQVDRASVEGILSSGKEVQKIVDALIEFVEHDVNDSFISADSVNLVRLVDAVCEQNLEICHYKSIQIRKNISSIQGIFTGDERRIKTIVQNIVSNAVKFTNSGYIEIKAEPVAGGVEIQVTDTGIGLRPDELEKVFTPFYKGQDLPKNCVAGVGLGLSIVKNNVQILGGSITVESRLNSGSRFTVIIPAELATEALAVPDSQSAGATSCTQGALRILVAEDNATNQLILKSILSHTDAECTFVENGLLAVEEFKRNRFSLVLMDINMPVMDGIEATKQIRDFERVRGGERSQIVAVTADVLTHQINQHRAAGIDGHIQKPIQVTEIFALLQDQSLYLRTEAA